ncbi:MAG: hypothetical protein ACI4YB_13385 [Oscillospiraceae bacterium]
MAKVFNSSFPPERCESSTPSNFNLYTILKSEEEAFAKSVEKQTETYVAEESSSCFGSQDSNEKAIDSNSEEDMEDAVYETIDELGKSFIKTFPKILESIADIISESMKKDE